MRQFPSYYTAILQVLKTYKIIEVVLTLTHGQTFGGLTNRNWFNQVNFSQ